MFKKNEYFDGAVASLGFDDVEGQATLGVMAPGEYIFGTTTIEIMTVLSGEMEVKLPEEQSFKTYKKFDSFQVPQNTKFTVKVTNDTPYLCHYK